MTTLLAELQHQADDEMKVMSSDGCGTYYIVRRRRLIAHWEITPGLPVRVRRYHQADDLEAAWAALATGRTWN